MFGARAEYICTSAPERTAEDLSSSIRIGWLRALQSSALSYFGINYSSRDSLLIPPHLLAPRKTIFLPKVIFVTQECGEISVGGIHPKGRMVNQLDLALIEFCPHRVLFGKTRPNPEQHDTAVKTKRAKTGLFYEKSYQAENGTRER